jgi:membrane-bound serine protease (ClpP class)
VAMSALPIRAGAVVLLVLGIALLIAEIFVANGALAAAGLVAMALGGVLLVDRFDLSWFVEPSFRIPLRVVAPTVAALGGVTAYVILRAAQARRLQQRGADVGMVGERGRALSAVGPGGGEVFVHGEIWRARAPGPIPADAPVVVKGVQGLFLDVDEVKA